ncbi:hypothetical protein BDQ17DRAFT_1358181 [Cyathus striatus]|nr:hypothetical protein BDQ17DRAFT_1358181 [Cyathus striatus]
MQASHCLMMVLALSAVSAVGNNVGWGEGRDKPWLSISDSDWSSLHSSSSASPSSKSACCFTAYDESCQVNTMPRGRKRGIGNRE